MDIIIRAIIAIFREIFEKDAERRRPKPATRKPKNLEDILEQLEKGQKPKPTPPKPRPQMARPKPVVQRVKPVLQAAEPPPLLTHVPEVPQADVAAVRKSSHQLLPGQNDLQNLIWAQTILGPCRAKEPYRLKM